MCVVVAQLADFGLSRVLDHEKHTHISTQTYGTVAYMPPELLSDSRLTRSADIYSFGMLMWELTSGEVRSPSALLEAVHACAPDKPMLPDKSSCLM